MADPIRERIFQAVVTALEEIEGESAEPVTFGLTVERNRETEVTADDMPRLVLLDGEEEADSGNLNVTVYRAAVTIEGYVKAEERALLAARVNMLKALVQRKMAEDPTFGGLALDVTEGESAVQTDGSGQEYPAAAFSIRYELTYWTQAGDPFTAGA